MNTMALTPYQRGEYGRCYELFDEIVSLPRIGDVTLTDINVALSCCIKLKWLREIDKLLQLMIDKQFQPDSNTYE